MTALDGMLWAALPVPALLLTGTGSVLDTNPVAESFLNLSRKALLGSGIASIVSCDLSFEAIIDRVEQGHTVVFVNDAMVGGGSREPVRCQIQIGPVDDGTGNLLLMMTPREVNAQIGSTRRAASAAKSAIGMAEMLAHEIKNPLAGITGAAQLLSMTLTGDDRELTDLIVEETRRVSKLLEQVEQFGNLLPPDRRAVNLHDILDRAKKSAQVGFAAKVKIQEDYDPSLPSALVDPDQLLQVFLNLLKNAAEALETTNDPHITLHSFYDHGLLVRSGGDRASVPLQIEVIDNGPGISPDIADHLFDPFVSGHENGTGLGLALVSKIIGENGGWVTVNSEPGKTVFRVSLPVASEQKGT